MGCKTTNKEESSSRSRRHFRQCQGRTKDGLRCRAAALKDSPYCAFHDRRLQKRIQEGRKRGGRVPRARILRERLKEIRSLSDMVDFLNTLIQDLYAGKLSAKQGQAIVSALSGIKSTIESMPAPVGEGVGLKLYDIDVDSSYDEPRPLPAPGEKGDSGSVVCEKEKPKALDVPSQDEKEKAGSNPLPQKEKKKPQDRPEPETDRSSVVVLDFCDSEQFWDYLEERVMGND